MEKNVRMGTYFQFYGELLSSKQREAVEKYYMEDLSLSEIAELDGITKQGVSETLRRAERKLTQFEQKLHLVERFLEIQKEVDEIESLLEPYREDLVEADEAIMRLKKLLSELL